MKVQITRPEWTRPYRHAHNRYELALRRLWSPRILEISDAEFEQIGVILGLSEPHTAAAPASATEAPAAANGPENGARGVA
jgi:hypothetical protein